MNVRSVLSLLSLGIRCGDRLDLIATGKQAREALAAIARYVGGDAGADASTQSHGGR